MPLFLNRLVGNRGRLQVDLSDGYYLSRDGRHADHAGQADAARRRTWTSTSV